MSVQQLISDGFELSGKWQLDGGGEPDFHLDNMDLAMQASVLYAFVCDDEIRYIGETSQKFCGRMCEYRQKLRQKLCGRKKWRKVHIHLHPKIVAGEEVLIYSRHSAPNQREQEEKRLIDKFNPLWKGGK